MNKLPTMTESNMPKEPSMWDNVDKRVYPELTGMKEAILIVEQSRTYNGGQMDLFPEELIKISSLFCGKVEANG